MKDWIKVKAELLGFDLFGVTHCQKPEQWEDYRIWIDAGFHGEMHYLEQHLPLKADPTSLLPTAQSLIVVGCNYYTPEGLAPAQIARYARGSDYHLLMKSMLENLAGLIANEQPHQWRSFVDSGPLLERNLAQRAGLGWQGKNSCLIVPGKGSWYLLGCLLTSLVLEPDQPFTRFQCGSCTRCIEACPTQAIVSPGQLDARKCLSYWNIEQRELIPEALREQMGSWIFGCDICQEVCPWNQRFAHATHLPDFYPRAWLSEMSLGELVRLSAHEFELKIAPRSPLKRPKYRGFIRNVAIAIGNSAQIDYVSDLAAARLLHAQDEMLMLHLDWASERLLKM